jgi:hypothetical protein
MQPTSPQPGHANVKIHQDAARINRWGVGDSPLESAADFFAKTGNKVVVASCTCAFVGIEKLNRKLRANPTSWCYYFITRATYNHGCTRSWSELIYSIFVEVFGVNKIMRSFTSQNQEFVVWAGQTRSSSLACPVIGFVSNWICLGHEWNTVEWLTLYSDSKMFFDFTNLPMRYWSFNLF